MPPTIGVDFHAHVFPPGMIPTGIHRMRAEARIAKSRGTIGPLGPDGEKACDELAEKIAATLDDPDGVGLRRDLEGAGIAAAVIIGLDWGIVDREREVLDPRDQIKWGLGLAERSAGFFKFVFGIDPRRPGSRELVVEALQAGCIGVKLYPPAGFSPADPVCTPIYEAVSAAGAFVMAHTGWTTFPFDMTFGRVEPYATVQRAHPEMRLILAHSGYPYWGDIAARVASAHGRSALEVSNWHHDIDSNPQRCREFLKMAWGELGPGRVLFGTDHVARARRSGAAKLAKWREFVEACAEDEGVDLTTHDAAAFSLMQSS